MYISTNDRKGPVAPVFDILRDEVPIEQVLSINGDSPKALCVAHDEQTPSMHVYEDHVYCFGCGFRGDVTDVWSKIQGIETPFEAALDLAREFGVALPEASPEAQQRARERREQEGNNLQLARDCHAALREGCAGVRTWWEKRGFGADLQKRFLLGANKGGAEAVIPFWHRGRVEGLIHRKLEGEPKYRFPRTEEFADGFKPLFVPGPVNGEVFLVEGIIDALAIVASGGSAIAIGGTALSERQEQKLMRLLPRTSGAYVLPDADERGAAAARDWAKRLYPVASVCKADYGQEGKDTADLFQVAGSSAMLEHLGRLVVGALDLVELETEAAKEIKGSKQQLVYATDHIIPLIAKISPASLQQAMLDIVNSQLKDVKRVGWLQKVLKEEQQRRKKEEDEQLGRMFAEEFERAKEEYRERVKEAQPDIDGLLAPGVLKRLTEAAAAMHSVQGDRYALKLALLVALGAQLAPLPDGGRPLGASMLLTAEAGRGKNHIVDAAVKPLPPEFYFSFEIASGQSLYYKALEDPGFLKHTFAYPNEIEGAEQLWEFLRPMLSKGKAKKVVTTKDADGNMTTKTIVVEGPVTIAIPTIRNKTDEQLQTRLLVAELPDFPGRVKEHSLAFSRQLHPNHANIDRSRDRFLWREGLRQLTEIRRVVFPFEGDSFAFDDDNVSHGARMWANVISLMFTNAWLEQRNRRILRLDAGELAIAATPEDYEEAYKVFTTVCKRSVINLSDTHRKILRGLYDLMEEQPNRDGFTQREIAGEAGVALGTVSNNKTFLATSAKLIRESEDGLILIEGADPTWWAEGDLAKGLPTPAQVYSWYPDANPEQGEHVQPVFTSEVNTQDGLDKPNTGNKGTVFSMFTGLGSSEASQDDEGEEI